MRRRILTVRGLEGSSVDEWGWRRTRTVGFGILLDKWRGKGVVLKSWSLGCCCYGDGLVVFDGTLSFDDWRTAIRWL